MIKSLIIRYPACQAMSEEALDRKFPSDGSLSSGLNLGLFCITLTLALVFMRQSPANMI